MCSCIADVSDMFWKTAESFNFQAHRSAQWGSRSDRSHLPLERSPEAEERPRQSRRRTGRQVTALNDEFRLNRFWNLKTNLAVLPWQGNLNLLLFDAFHDENNFSKVIIQKMILFFRLHKNPLLSSSADASLRSVFAQSQTIIFTVEGFSNF